MKKNINGRQYNTETAQQVGDWYNGQSDPERVVETLYQKRGGEFFLFGDGGAATRYAVQTAGTNWAGGERIIPLSYEQARNWAREHLGVEAYEAVFGEVSEDDARKSINLSLATSTIEQAKRKSAQHGQTVSAWVEALILAAN